MTDVRQPPMRPLPHRVGSQSLYQSPRILESEQQRVDRAKKRESRLKIIRSIKAKKG